MLHSCRYGCISGKPAASSPLGNVTVGQILLYCFRITVGGLAKSTSASGANDHRVAGCNGVARLLAHRLMVMKDGRVVESGLTDQVLDDPQHPYTQTLVASVLPV